MRSVRRLICRWPTAPLLALVVTCTAAAVLSSVQAGAAPRADGPTDDAAVHSYLEDPGRVAEGQVAPHARLWPYADDGSAVRAGDSPYVRSLGGAWKFTLADKLADVPGDTSNGENVAGDGGPLRIGATTFAKGFGAHANSSITLDLPVGRSRFRSTVGLDEEVGGSGSVTFEVRSGGTVLASTPRLTGGSNAVELDAALTGQAQLQLVVTDAGDGNGSDHADWAAARLTCA